MEPINQNFNNQNPNNMKNKENLIGNCLDDFEFLKIFGCGGFGCVFKVRSKKNNKLYALKKINFRNEEEKLKTKKEIILLKYLDHENICKCFSEFKTQDGTQYMVMEQYNNKDLYEYVRVNFRMNHHIREEIIWNIIFQCLEGLSYLHLQGIIHCDIKLGNIFMTEEGKVVIGDFGESMVKNYNILQRITQNVEEQNILKYIRQKRGSPGYFAPEIDFTGCSEKTDVYSLGVCFYALLYYDTPKPETIEENFRKKNYSDELKSLIKGMITENQLLRKDLVDVKKECNKFYYQRYIKNSGIHSVTQCLLNYSNLRKTFSSNSLLANNDDQSGPSIGSINVSFIFISIYSNTDIEINNYYLKKFFSEQFKINIKDNNDISPLKAVFCIINSLNNDLNQIKVVHGEKNSQIQKALNRKEKLENDTNVTMLYNRFKNEYRDHFKSVITNDYLGVLRVNWSCLSCHTNYISFERFFSITFNINNIKDTKINILDLFKKYNEKIYEISLKKFVKCENCKRFTQHSMNKNFYILPNNLIIMFSRKNNNQNTEIEIPKEIKFNKSIVESFPKKDIIFNLQGIIYENENLNENSKYIPIINDNNKWYQYKYGQTKQEINFEALYNYISKKVIALFYNKYDPIAKMFSSQPKIENIPVNNEKEEEIKTILVVKKLQKNNNNEFNDINNVNINNFNSNMNSQNMIPNNIPNNNQNNQNNNISNDNNQNFKNNDNSNQNKNNMMHSQNIPMNNNRFINNISNFSNNMGPPQQSNMSNSMNNLNNQFDNIDLNQNNNMKNQNYTNNMNSNQNNNMSNSMNNLNNQFLKLDLNQGNNNMNNNQMVNMNMNMNNNQINNQSNFGMNNNMMNNNQVIYPNNMNMNNNNMMNSNNRVNNQMNNNMNNQNQNFNQNNNINFMNNNNNVFPNNNNLNSNQNNMISNTFNNMNNFTNVNNNQNNFNFFNNNNTNVNNNLMGMNNNNNFNRINGINQMNTNSVFPLVSPNINLMNQMGINLNNNNMNNFPMPMQNNINANNMMNFNGMNMMNNMNNFSMANNNK